MVFSPRTLAAMTALFLTSVQAQTWTKCNPLKTTCPADPALGRSVTVDFTSGKSNEFTGEATSYNSEGVQLTVAGSGQAPTLMSNWYIMFGRVDITMKTAPGAGLVSSFVLQSDDLDEVDWEFLGAEPSQIQTNFFGKGITGSYDRGANFNIDDTQAEFHTYTVDWNADSLVWAVDGKTLRTVTPDDWPGQYPQTPMQIKFGPWAAGDPKTNPQGTVSWAEGPVDWSAGPFTMTVQSISVQDYSTGSEYKYTDNTGSWQSIEAVGGSVGSEGSGSAPAPKPSSSTIVPGTTTPSKPVPTSGSPSVPASQPGDYTSTVVNPSPSWTASYTTVTTPTTYQPSAPVGTPSSTMSPIPDNSASGQQMTWGLSVICAILGVAGAAL